LRPKPDDLGAQMVALTCGGCAKPALQLGRLAGGQLHDGNWTTDAQA
jgi:hypothetical protein